MEINDLEAGIAIAEATKERLKTDPEAVRKILGNNVQISEQVTVYPDKNLNREYAEFDQKLQKLADSTVRREGETDEEFIARNENVVQDYEAARKEFDELKLRVKESGVTFTLVSVGKKAIKNLRTAARKKFPNEDNDPDVAEQLDDYYRASIVAAHLVADGYTIDDVFTIMDEWPIRCWAELWTTAQRLSIADDYLGNLLTPDF